MEPGVALLCDACKRYLELLEQTLDHREWVHREWMWKMHTKNN
jgi:hypothetical protein